VLMLAGLALGATCAGPKGEQGPQGDPGADGVGIQNVVNNANGTITISLTDGHNYTTDDLTGPQGPQGATGAQGPRGAQGVPGPNMVVAMGNFINGQVNKGYNVTNVIFYTDHAYHITLTGITYNCSAYVALVTLQLGGSGFTVRTACFSGDLVVYIYDAAGNPIEAWFSFVVLGIP